MQVLKVYKNPDIWFDLCVDLTVDAEFAEEHIPPEIEKICEWLSNTFAHNFVMLEKATRIIAGGAADAKLGWNEGWNVDSQFCRTDEYQLRGHSEDITMFLLQYGDRTQ